MALYVVDSNFFIEAHRRTYPLDIATGFWNKVQELANLGTIVSIDKVKNELYSNNDALKNWCETHLPETFFYSHTETMQEYARVSAWAMSMNQHYLPRALHEFLDANEADAFLVAFALANPNERKIVTQEISEPNRKNRIKIPDCCEALGVVYCNTIEMFRELGETF